jgi:hypothetical protein
MRIVDRDVERVALVDDQEEVRAAYQLTVEDAELVPVSEDGPLENIAQLVTTLSQAADAAICDQHLQLVGGYADFFGAELVASLYQQQFPAILCTRWEEAHMDVIRTFRRYVPVMMRPDELTPDSLIAGVEVCLREFHDGFAENRRAWRTQVHVVDVDGDDGIVFVEVPAWNRDEIVRLRLQDFPEAARPEIRPGFRCHASVNIGTEQHQDLFFETWEA